MQKEKKGATYKAAQILISPSLKEARGALCLESTLPQEACADYKLHLSYMLITEAK